MPMTVNMAQLAVKETSGYSGDRPEPMQQRFLAFLVSAVTWVASHRRRCSLGGGGVERTQHNESQTGRDAPHGGTDRVYGDRQRTTLNETPRARGSTWQLLGRRLWLERTAIAAPLRWPHHRMCPAGMIGGWTDWPPFHPHLQ